MAHNVLKAGSTEIYLRPSVTEIVHRGKSGDTRRTIIENFNSLPMMKFEEYIIVKESGSPDGYYNIVLGFPKRK